MATKVNRASRILAILGMSTIVVVAVFVLLIELFYPRVILFINRKLWQVSEPTEYYFRLTEGQAGGTWCWDVYVLNGVTISAEQTCSHPSNDNSRPSLDPNSMSMQQVFLYASEHCTHRGFLDCGLEFDGTFHFLSYLYSYEVAVIRVEEFISCDHDQTQCSNRK
jgi:hypothetical protein